MSQRVVAHTVVAHWRNSFEGVQRLRALADNVADVLAGGQMIRHSDAKHLDGCHAANVRNLWRRIFSVLALAVWLLHSYHWRDTPIDICQLSRQDKTRQDFYMRHISMVYGDEL